MKLISSPWIVAIILLISNTCPGVSNAQDTYRSKWTVTGSLLTARVCHTATLLSDGRVLVLGGYGITGELASAELYTPKEGTFARAADMATARCNHTATLLPNGQVLVVGGQFHGNTLASAELYDPTTNIWSNTGSLHIARSYHTATLLPNGQVLVAGGTRFASPPVFAQGAPPGGALDIAELYDPASGKWTVSDNLHSARYEHIATLLPNGQVLVAGGIGSTGGVLASTELYNSKTGSWKVTNDLLVPLFEPFSILLPNHLVLLLGGKPTFQSDSSISELYNASNGTWNPTGNSHTAVNGPCLLLPDSKVLVAGGANNSRVLATTELYDPTTGTWEMTGAMNTARCLHTATLLKDGSVLVTGGLYELGSPTNVLASAELYNTPGKSNQANNQKPVAGGIILSSSTPANPTISSLFTLTMCLVIFTGCLVVLTACVVILLCAWLVFSLVRRWGK